MNAMKFSQLRVNLFLITIPSLFLAMRGTATFSNSMFNPDEAEFLAQGRLASDSVFPYENYVTSTSGPVTPEILGLLNSLGITLDLRLAHIYSASVTIAILLLFASIINPAYSSITKTLVLAPVITAWGSGDRQTFNTDFLSLSSEITPLFFLSLAAYLLTRQNQLKGKMSFVAGTLSGLAFLTKYQVIVLLAIFPILIMLYSFNSKTITLQKRFVSLGLWGLGASIPLVVIAFLLKVSNNIESAAYSISILVNYGSGNISTFSQSSISDRVLGYFTVAVDSPIVVLALLVLVFLMALSVNNETKVHSYVFLKDTIVLFLILLLGYLSAALAGNNFGHYIQLWLWSIGISIAILLTRPFLSNSLKVSAPIHTCVFFLVWAALSFNAASLNWEKSASVAEASDALPAKRLNEVCPEKSNVMVWGWAAEMFAYNNWQPPTFFVNNAVLLIGGEDGPDSWNYNVTVNAITDPGTACVVEAIGPSFFGSIDPEQGKISSVDPFLSELLTRHYEQVEVSDSPATVYVRK
jgi:hypothetical protein